MCGRFALYASGEEIATLFDLPEAPTLAPRYNIAPTQPVAALRTNPHSRQREFTYFQWGLIPSWSKDPAIGSRMINARSETAAEKPSFRGAMKYRRCLVPANGFYEWEKQNGSKQPYFIHMAGQRPFAIAGLWEHWQSPEGSEIESLTLLTTHPNELIKSFHNRMPVILHPDDFEVWLDPAEQQPEYLQHLLDPYPAEAMAAYPVSTTVNSAYNEDPACIEPI